VEASDDLSLNQILDAHWGVLTDEDVRNLVPACNLFLLSPF
jgi:acetolactate synthase-1/3 small subunit